MTFNNKIVEDFLLAKIMELKSEITYLQYELKKEKENGNKQEELPGLTNVGPSDEGRINYDRGPQ